jgi:hypothetical protein
MLKHLMILTVLVALAPVPRQSVESSAQGADKGQSQGNHATAAPTHSLVEQQEQPGASNPHSGQIASEDKEHSVKLTSLPPVTITDKQKTIWDHVLDWGPWAFNFLLVVVGGFQVWLLWKTWQKIGKQAELMEGQLGEMKTQAGLMKAQAQIMNAQAEHMASQVDLMKQQLTEMQIGSATAKLSAEAAKESAEVARSQTIVMKDRERARLIIQSADSPGIWEAEPAANNLHPVVVRLFVANIGPTVAFRARAYAAIEIVKKRSGGLYQIGFQQELPMNIRNTDGLTPPTIDVLGFGREYHSHLMIDDFTAKNLREGEWFLQVSGMLVFTDIYEDVHEFPFRYIWASEGNDNGGHWLTDARWYDIGVAKAEVDADRVTENPS